MQLFNIMSFPNHTELAIDVTNEYSFITVQITDGGQSFAEIRFELTDEAGKIVSVFCENDALQKN
jgi:hypothetical protein